MQLEKLLSKKRKEFKLIVFLIGAIFLIPNEVLYARIPDLGSRLYRATQPITDISFNIISPSSNIMIQEKLGQKSQGEIKFKIYSFKNQSDIVFDSLGVISKEIRKSIEIPIRKKAKIILGLPLKDWLKGYEFVEENNGWFSYVDGTGLNDVAKIKVRFLQNSVKIVQKKPTGTLKTDYNYKVTSWSKEQLVLYSVHKEMYEGIQSVTTDSIISYKEIEGIGYLPAQVNVSTVQRLSLGTKDNIERVLEEVYFYTDLQVNKGVGKEWFSRKKSKI